MKQKRQIAKILMAMLLLCVMIFGIVQTAYASSVVYIGQHAVESYFERQAIRYDSQIPAHVRAANPNVQTDYYYLQQYGFSRSTSWTSVGVDYHYLDHNGNNAYDKWHDTLLYCMQRIKLAPNPTNSPKSIAYQPVPYTLNETTKRGLLIIWQNGFPFNNMGLSDNQALYATQQAMRCWLAEQERNGCDGAVYHYNWDDVANFTNLRPNGSSASYAVWNAMADLLNKARSVWSGNWAERISSISAYEYHKTISNGYFISTIAVNPVNCNNGFSYSINGPSGTFVTQSGNTLYVHIPFSAANANRTFTLAVYGHDNMSTHNMVFYGPVSASNRQVVAGLDTNQVHHVATATASITTTAPNLQVHNLRLTGSKTEFEAGENIPIQADIANVIAGTALNSTTRAELINIANGHVYETKNIATGEIAGHSSRRINTNFTTPGVVDGTRLAVRVTADANNNIIETVKTDNVATMNITVRGLPDLVVHTLTTDKGVYEAGETVTVNVTVRNVGGSTAGASILRVAPQGLTPATVTIPALAKGQTSAVQTFTFTAMTELTDTLVKIVATADATNVVWESDETNNTKETSIMVLALKPDLTFGDDSSLVSTYYTGKDFVVAVQVRNLTLQPVPDVEVQLKLGNQTVIENICVPGYGTNIAVFRVSAPAVPGSYPVLLKIDPNDKIEERPPDGELNNESNEDFTIRYDGSAGAVRINILDLVRNEMPDPFDSMMEADHHQRNKAVPELPTLGGNTHHTWSEIRYVNGQFVTRSYWANLTTTFSITPDPRVYIKDHPNLVESGFGVYTRASTQITTNYDRPEKLISPQVYWVMYPEMGYWNDPNWYRYTDSLEIENGILGQIDRNTWHYAVNPYSVTESRLHYTPVWFPDGMYEAVGQAFYGWSPAGQLHLQRSDSVDIEGNMYERFPVLNR